MESNSKKRSREEAELDKDKDKYSYTQRNEEEKYELGDNMDWINWGLQKLETFHKNFYVVAASMPAIRRS
jgi:hypothetical protein